MTHNGLAISSRRASQSLRRASADEGRVSDSIGAH
jgi:hypothetical protein